MSIPLSHHGGLVTQGLAHYVKWNPRHYSPRSERMSQRVKADFFPTIIHPFVQTDAVHHPLEGLAEPHSGLAMAGLEYRFISEPQQSLQPRLLVWDP